MTMSKGTQCMRIYKDASEISLVIARQKLPKTRRHYCVHKSEPAMERVCGVTHELLRDVIFASLVISESRSRERILAFPDVFLVGFFF